MFFCLKSEIASASSKIWGILSVWRHLFSNGVMAGSISLRQSLGSSVGIGSRGHVVLGDLSGSVSSSLNCKKGRSFVTSLGWRSAGSIIVLNE